MKIKQTVVHSKLSDKILQVGFLGKRIAIPTILFPFLCLVFGEYSWCDLAIILIIII